MRVYVAGRLTQRERVQKVMAELQKNGFEITYDWTREESTNEADFTKERLQEIAKAELQGVLDADLFLMLATADGAGQYVELGAAIVGGLPIFLVDPNCRKCIFFHLADETFENEDQAIAAMTASREKVLAALAAQQGREH